MERLIKETDRSEQEIGREVVYQFWIESERGWGIRPDGYSLHLSLFDRKRFVEEYWKSMPDEVPDEYSRPEGYPQPQFVDQSIYQRLIEAKANGRYGLRFFGSLLP